MKISLNTTVYKVLFNTIVFLVIIKLLTSYLTVKLHYFQRHLASNYDSFNFFNLPFDFSNKIEFCLFPLLIIFILRYKHYWTPSKYFILISFCAYTLNFITSLKNDISLFQSLIYSLKLFTPLYFFCALIIYSKISRKKLNKIFLKFSYFCLFLGVIALLFFNPSYNRLQNYLPIFYDSIHTHNYLMVSLFIGISYSIYRSRLNFYYLITFFAISFLFLFFGYNVRTALIMYLIYILMMLFLISNFFKILIFKILVFTPLIVIMIIFIKSEVDWVEISSGRTAMYTEKINQISGFNFFDWIFGQGSGADLIKTKVWWWDKKGAHSDIITIFIENGILYVALFFSIFYLLLRLSRKTNLIFLAIIFGSIFTSFISNGIIFRPHASYILNLVLAYIFIDINNKDFHVLDSKNIPHNYNKIKS